MYNPEHRLAYTTKYILGSDEFAVVSCIEINPLNSIKFAIRLGGKIEMKFVNNNLIEFSGEVP